MRRRHDLLTAKRVENEKQPGYHLDGGGLYLQVSPKLTKSWIFRYARAGRGREMGLGSTLDVSLTDARRRAANCRQLLLDRIDPIDTRDADKARKAVDAARAVTFAECARSYVEAHKASWKNAKHVDQWTNTLETYCGPVIGALPVRDVDTVLVIKVLEPIWTTKPETAGRLRARIERVLDSATVREQRAGENPARWRGHLDKLLPTISRRRRIKHHPALPYRELPPFVAELRAQEGSAARALEFTILTAARTGETIGAAWPEIDFAEKVWTVPASRMKGQREHRVPLTERALEILDQLRGADSTHVFPGRKKGEALSNMAMLKLLARMRRPDLTVHGFRSTFSDWVAERTGYAREVREMSLAHAVSDQVEAAYRRGDLFEKRRRLMNEWAKYCSTVQKQGDIVPIKSKTAA